MISHQRRLCILKTKLLQVWYVSIDPDIQIFNPMGLQAATAGCSTMTSGIDSIIVPIYRPWSSTAATTPSATAASSCTIIAQQDREIPARTRSLSMVCCEERPARYRALSGPLLPGKSPMPFIEVLELFFANLQL